MVEGKAIETPANTGIPAIDHSRVQIIPEGSKNYTIEEQNISYPSRPNYLAVDTQRNTGKTPPPQPAVLNRSPSKLSPIEIPLSDEIDIQEIRRRQAVFFNDLREQVLPDGKILTKEDCAGLTALFFGLFARKTLDDLQQIVAIHNSGATSFFPGDYEKSIRTGEKLLKNRSLSECERELYQSLVMALCGRSSKPRKLGPYMHVARTVRAVHFLTKFEALTTENSCRDPDFLALKQSRTDLMSLLATKFDLDLATIDNIRKKSRRPWTLTEECGRGIMILLFSNKNLKFVYSMLRHRMPY